MIGNQGFAFLNHGDRTADIEPMWAGVVPWIVFILVVTGLKAIFG